MVRFWRGSRGCIRLFVDGDDDDDGFVADCDRDRTADISCAMIVRRDFDALKTFVVDGDGDGGEERTETEKPS